MIQPEIKVIKEVNWEHKSLLKPEFFPNGICPNDESPLVQFIDPQTKKIIQVQVICTACQRSLTLYGKN